MLARASWIAVSVLVFASCSALSGLPGDGGLATESTHSAPSGSLAFPGALGWAAGTPGGRGGEIIRVTNLNAEGPGSFRAAVETKGPRIVVFEVGGVIDLGARTLTIREPFLTIAGQTAPSPGITLHPRRHRHRHARRHRAAHPRAPRHGRRRVSQRPGLRFHLHPGRRLQRHRRPLLADLGHRREPLRLRPPLHRADASRTGARAPRTTSPSRTTSSPRASPSPPTPRASTPRAR